MQRYVKVAKAYQYFIQNEDIHSFLCLLNKFPKTAKNDHFQLELLKELFTELRMKCRQETQEEANAKVEQQVEVLSSHDFEEKQRHINQRLAGGEKVFLISTYQTMGAGQNIQYPSPNAVPVIAINDLTYGQGEKDYDAIYLEKPTHLLQYFQPGEEISDQDLLNYLFEVEYLAEGGAISRKEKQERIRYVFRRRLQPKLQPSPKNKLLYERIAVIQHAIRVIIQAVGRLSRTRLKNRVTHILYDDKISEYLQNFHLGSHLFVPEFEALYRDCLAVNGKNKSPKIDFEYQNLNHSYTLAALLRRLVHRIPDWNKASIHFWENLRTYVLKNPTVSNAQIQKSGLQKFYIKSPDGKPFAKSQYYS